MMPFLKLVTIVTWAVLIASLFYPIGGPETAQNLQIGLVILIFAHIVEILIFSKKIKATDNPSMNAFKVLIFGFVHAQTLGKA